MKHDTHIYIAVKAVELIRQSVDNLHYPSGRIVSGRTKSKERATAKELQRIMKHYLYLTEEATWAPDDILKDNDPNHIFKLFTDDEFPDHGLTTKPQYVKDGVTYYKFGGALPFRVDHVSQLIMHMAKLREYNDRFQLRQIIYQFMLLSHYIADAHVPMHCDLRDDPPKKKQSDPSRRAGTNKPEGKYMKESTHGKLEKLWDKAVVPVALNEKIIKQSWNKQNLKPTDLSGAVTFTLDDCKQDGIIKTIIIPKYGLMDFMIDLCIKTKQRSRLLFPLDNPEQMQKDILEDTTLEIFAECIGNLISIWRYIWVRQED